jgi:hypothetical protein
MRLHSFSMRGLKFLSLSAAITFVCVQKFGNKLDALSCDREIAAGQKGSSNAGLAPVPTFLKETCAWACVDIPFAARTNKMAGQRNRLCKTQQETPGKESPGPQQTIDTNAQCEILGQPQQASGGVQGSRERTHSLGPL